MTTSTPTIEQLWQELRRASSGSLQRRIDATHPLDLYVDFEPPDRPGLVAVCSERPPGIHPLRAVSIEQGRRVDGRWSLRLSLEEPRLLPVFAALCRDIVVFTREGASEAHLGASVLARLNHWRTLLERDASGMGEPALRGLVGELLVLEQDVLPLLSPAEAVEAWTGPLGTAQDFILPTGRRIEVKTVRRNATTIRINGLDQLDPGADVLVVAVVRLDDTGPTAPGAITAPALVEGVRAKLAASAEAIAAFAEKLEFVGWHDHPSDAAHAWRVVDIERHVVGEGFPRLMAATVPEGIEDADYIVVLPVPVPQPGVHP